MADAPSIPCFYGVQEAAEILHCSSDAIYAMVQDERLPYARTGRRFLWTLDEVLAARTAPRKPKPVASSASQAHPRGRRGTRRI